LVDEARLEGSGSGLVPADGGWFVANMRFLVLSGECLLLVEGEERGLEAWD
jgi:hypothetical protein